MNLRNYILPGLLILSGCASNNTQRKEEISFVIGFNQSYDVLRASKDSSAASVVREYEKLMDLHGMKYDSNTKNWMGYKEVAPNARVAKRERELASLMDEFVKKGIN